MRTQTLTDIKGTLSRDKVLGGAYMCIYQIPFNMCVMVGVLADVNITTRRVCDVFRKNKKVLCRPLSRAGDGEIEVLCDWAH